MRDTSQPTAPVAKSSPDGVMHEFPHIWRQTLFLFLIICPQEEGDLAILATAATVAWCDNNTRTHTRPGTFRIPNFSEFHGAAGILWFPSDPAAEGWRASVFRGCLNIRKSDISKMTILTYLRSGRDFRLQANRMLIS